MLVIEYATVILVRITVRNVKYVFILYLHITDLYIVS